jgi:uncharacterized protein (TIGR02596 family)
MTSLRQIHSIHVPPGTVAHGIHGRPRRVCRSRLVAGAGGRKSWTSVYPVDDALDNAADFSNLNGNQLRTPMTNHRTRAFSLIELLVVIAVIGIVASFAIPAVQGSLRGSALTTSAGMLTDQMSLARQHALSKNRVVEVRFYRYADNEQPGEDVEDPSTGHFRAFQLFEVSDSAIVIPIGKVTRLPETIIMNHGERLSTIIGEDIATRLVKSSDLNRKLDPELPRGVKHNYEYRMFRFNPDGTTSLSPTGKIDGGSKGGRWFITVHASQDLHRTDNNEKAPPNLI